MNVYYLITSFAFLVISTFLAIFSHKIFKKAGKLKPIYILIIGIFLALFTFMLYIDHQPERHGYNTTLFLALFHSVQIMLAGYEYDILHTILDITKPYSALAYTYASLLFFLSPIYSFGFVLSFFEKFTSYLNLFFNRRKDLYIISDYSEKSVILAESIRDKFPKSLIVICKPVSSSEDSALIDISSEKIHKIKPILLPDSLKKVNLKFLSKKSKLTLFVVSENESENISLALSLIENLNTRADTELYVSSTTLEGGLLLEATDFNKMKVRRINETRSLAYWLLLNHPITDNYVLVDGKKTISVLMVGFGKHGREIVNSLLWCGQLPDYDLKINVVDSNPDAKSQYAAMCPEIIALNGNTELGEARYQINFHDGINVDTVDFYNMVAELKDTSLVYVALGSDESDIETAIKLRIQFERMGINPVIRAIAYSDVMTRILKTHTLSNHRNDSFDIEIAGDAKTRYSYDAIVNDELEKVALSCHLMWSNTPEKIAEATAQFNNHEYYRNSSIATAIHEKYREKAALPKDMAAISEHMRWNAYMRTEGYIYTGSPDSETRNDKAMMHNNLHPYNLLNQENINKDLRIAYKGK